MAHSEHVWIIHSQTRYTDALGAFTSLHDLLAWLRGMSAPSAYRIVRVTQGVPAASALRVWSSGRKFLNEH
jgi:hypothetical protein